MEKPKFINEDPALPEIFSEIVSVKDLISNSKGLVVIDNEAVTQRLENLALKHNATDYSQEENIKHAREARAELRQPRYDLDKIEKHNNSIIDSNMKALKKGNSEQINSLKAIVGTLETKIDEIIKSEETKAEQRRKAKEIEEKQRTEEIFRMINDWKDCLVKIESNILVGKESTSQLTANLESLEGEFEKFEEFAYMAQSIVAGYVAKIDMLKARENEFIVIANQQKINEDQEKAKQIAQQEQANLLEKKTNVLIQTLMQKGAKMLDANTYDYKGTKFSRSVLMITDLEQFDLAINQADQNEKDRAELNAQMDKIKAESEAFAKQKAEHQALADAQEKTNREVRIQKEQEGERVAKYNELLSIANKMNLAMSYKKASLTDIPPHSQIVALQQLIDERNEFLANAQKDEVSKLAQEIKSKMIKAYIDHFQQGPTLNPYVDAALQTCYNEIEASISKFGDKLIIPNNDKKESNT